MLHFLAVAIFVSYLLEFKKFVSVTHLKPDNVG